jgi:predicted AlkP superfamily pyrophosphatase or phosphodiesterase
MSKKKGVGIPKLKAIRSNGTSNFAATTILISLDGFRADFLSRGLTPTLNAFIAEGVSPKYMLPSFPSVTFPNHYTLVTGLYPESHGVVGNTFWDPILKEEFYYTDPARSMQPKWWISGGAEPLWSTAESQGVRSAIHMWPGSEAHIQLEPTFVDKFNGTEALSRKVDRVLGLLDLPTELDSGIVSISESRPQFIAMYVPDVDQDGHKFGPNSTEITKTITSVDTMLHDFFHGLQQRNLTDVVNVVIVSDHGMATTSSDRLIQLEDLIDVSLVEHIDGWPLFGLRMKADKDLRPMYEALLAKSANNPNIEVYLRENMPKRYHFSKNERIAPLWIIPKTGWAIVERKDFDIQEAKKTNKIYHPRGLHGYDHEHPLMRAIFIARGPAFPHKPNSQVAVFQNTEVYNIVCDSLEIIPHPNNGTLHLPLTPIGVHPGIPDTPVFPDFPPTTVGQSSVPTSHFATISTSIPPVSVGVDIPDPIPIRPVISNGNGPPDDKKGGNRPKTWWQYLVDKLEEGKAWASKLFNELKGEEGQSKKQES